MRVPYPSRMVFARKGENTSELMMPLTQSGKCPDVLILQRDDWLDNPRALFAGSVHVLAPEWTFDQVRRDIGVQLLPIAHPKAAAGWKRIAKPPHVFAFWFNPEDRCDNFDAAEYETCAADPPVILVRVPPDYKTEFWPEWANEQIQQGASEQRQRLRELHGQRSAALLMPRHRFRDDTPPPEPAIGVDGRHRTLSLGKLLR